MYSTFKTLVNLAIALIAYAGIWIVTWTSLCINEAKESTIATTHFFFIIYLVMILAIAAVDLSRKLSVKLIKGLLLISLGIILSGIISLIVSYFYSLSLININGWASVIGGTYLLLFWLFYRGGVSEK
ncbi:MAG: hypothetical protein WAW11_04700 [Patescibacteria group bacterium]